MIPFLIFSALFVFYLIITVGLCYRCEIKTFLYALVAFGTMILILSFYGSFVDYDKLTAHQNAEYLSIFFKAFFEEVTKAIGVVFICKVVSAGQRLSFSICVVFSLFIAAYENYGYNEGIYLTAYYSITQLNDELYHSLVSFFQFEGYVNIFALGWLQILRIFIHTTLLIMTIYFIKTRCYWQASLLPIMHGTINICALYVGQHFTAAYSKVAAGTFVLSLLLLLTLLFAGRRYRSFLERVVFNNGSFRKVI